MEAKKNIEQMLDQILQPGFLVEGNRITTVNQAARALLLTPGQDFSILICTGVEDYAALETGHLSLTLTIAGTSHNAVISRMHGFDLVLLDSREEMDEFRSMALVSMEMRKPLMQAISSARQLDPKDPGTARMNQSLMQMLRLVSNLSDIGRYQTSAKMELRDVDAFLLELFQKADALTGGKISLRFESLKQPVFSLMDPEQLERAVWNILSNCIKFLPEGGTIEARLTQQRKMLRLTVEDSGSGIEESVRANLFCRYLRQPGIEDSRYGLGLGLAIVRAAAANHGGTVLISSGKTGGTRITITMAIRQDDSNLLRSPLLRPDYAGGWDHGLVELSDCLMPELYSEL